MASKKEIKELLKELNLTENDMQKYWNECILVNWKVSSLNKCGKNWNDLSIHAIKSLPTLKETTLKQQEEEILEKERKLKEEQERKEKEKYYEEHFEEIMVENIDKNKSLTEHELQRLVYEYEIDRQNGENNRWNRYVTSIVELCKRTFCIEWQQGLTEQQPNYFDKQPYEVIKKIRKKTITVTEWNKK